MLLLNLWEELYLHGWTCFRYHTSDIFVIFLGCLNVVRPSQHSLYMPHIWEKNMGKETRS